MRTIDIIFAAQEKLNAHQAVVVVIDVLRATSSIITALHNGCREIIPAASIAEARHWAGMDGVLLAGERDAKKPPNFDLDNSPLKFSVDRVAGKRIVLTTTNGTRALRSIFNAREVVLASFLNSKALVGYLSRNSENVLFYCAGWKGAFSLEDTLCASIIMARLQKQESALRFSDAAQWGLWSLQALFPGPSDITNASLLAVVGRSTHALRLKALGLHEDIAFCCTLDRYDIIPVLDRSNSIKSKHL